MDRLHIKIGLIAVLMVAALISPACAQSGNLALPQNEACASDWPTWRYDAHRSASAPDGLPAELHLQWEHQYTARERVWNDPLNWDMMRYDRNFEPIVVGDTMFLAFSDSDKIVALDIETGEETWRFYTDGPVRLPPAVWDGQLYATSDDGYLYCLNAATGDLNWKFQAAPGDRKVLGNNRLISTWPARGGVVIEDDRVYFAASIFPMMGTFIYCLDAGTGDVIWLNDGESARWTDLPHGRAEGFGGIAPQGALTISGDKLLVPGGRSVPACLDKNTGEFEYYRLSSNAKNGGDFVAANDRVFFNHYVEKSCNMFDTSTGDKLVSKIGRYPVIDGDTIYTSYEGTVAAYSIAEGAEWGTNQLWTISADATGDLIKAGNRLYASGDNSITAIEIGSGKPTIVWVIPVNDVVERLVAANGKLFAVTLDGRIMAFGGVEVEPNRILDIPAPAAVSQASTEEARSILEKTGVSEGYALFYGIGDGDLLEALACNSELDIIAVDEDCAIVEEMRRRFDENGLYGKRISVLQGDPLTLKAQSYMATLTIVNIPVTSEVLEALCDSVRPYGGKLVIRMSTGWSSSLSNVRAERSQNVGSYTSESVDIGMNHADVQSAIRNMKSFTSERVDIGMVPTTKLHTSKGKSGGIRSSGIRSGGSTMIILTREGPLDGSAPFTHNVGDIANTGKTDDELVKPPLGVLWFGGELSNVDVLPRHGHGPPPQVIGGRLFIEGLDKLTCVDVYTGRQIWQRQFDDMETYNIYYDESHKDAPTVKRYNQEHLAGANIRGTNYVATEDKIYIINARDLRHEHWAQVLDAATGELLMNIELPEFEEEQQSWGYIGVYEDLLIGGGELVPFSDVAGASKSDYDLRKNYNMRWEDYDYSASERLYVMDRHSGAVKWSFESEFGFLHNGIVAGEVGGKEMLFVLDKLHPGVEAQLERRGEEIPTGYRLVAMDINTGNHLWETTDCVFGSYLSLSEEYSMLLESTRASRDTVNGESGTRMVAYDARNGNVLWNESAEYKAFPILHHDTIICGAESWKPSKQAKHFSLLTGDRLTRESPITGSEVELRWARGYGCNHPLASEHMVFFRSGAAGYFDLNQNSGTGNFGGFKTGCTESLVAADGVLNSPDYTRTCICAYQNQLSLAMVHMPENEAWTLNELDLDSASIEKIGLNIGAPGDRVSETDTWWFEYPVVGGPSPDIPAETTGDAEYFTHHSSRFEGEIPWVAASGCEGLSSLALNNVTGNYTVRLYFAEPDDVAAGGRVFDVALQGEVVLSDFDVVSEAGETRKTVVKSFDGIMADGDGQLVVTFNATGDLNPIINGIEVISEDNHSISDPPEPEPPSPPEPQEGDWPQYRADAGHSGYTTNELSSDLSLLWKYEGRAPEPAWTGIHTRMTFDYACEPVVSGDTLYFGSSSDCKVYALDASTGEERWTFFTDAPVRLAPAVWDSQVFVTSDDGCLYCLSAEDGGLIWKKDPPVDSYKLGNDRMVSNWPARGGVAIKDDVLYYGVGIWPTDEIYIYALDPATGNVTWVNDTCGNLFIGQPHTNSLAYSGISAQGHLTVAGDHVYVPTGRAVPAAFDIHTGELDYFFLEKYRELGGSRLFAAATDDYDYFFATSGNTRFHDEIIGKRHTIFDGESGLLLTTCELDSPGLTFSTEQDILYYLDSTDRELKANSLSGLLHETQERRVIATPMWTVKTPEPADTISMIMADDIIIAGTENNKVMIMSGAENRDIRTIDVDGVPYSLAVAGGNLYVSTDEGTIYCFGASTGDAAIVQSKPAVVDPYNADETVVNAAKNIIEESGITEGYCLDAGCGDGALAYELAKRTDLHIIAIDHDPVMVALAREKLDAAGLYGTRVTVHQCDISSADRYPDYFANLVVSGRSVTEGADAVQTEDVYHCLRPCGGVMTIGTPDAMEVTVRPALEGAGDWTHFYADAGSTVCSDDQLVNGELGMLWWNDPDFDTPSRHGRGVSPLYKDGIMVCQGVDEIRAYDAYNGREIWRFSLEDIGKPYDQDNFCVGSCITHGNMAIDGDTLYIRAGKVPTSYFRYTLALDLHTGNLLREYQVPNFPDPDFDKCYVDEGYEAGCGMKDYGWGPFDWNHLPDYAYWPGSKWGYFSVDDGTIVGGIADTDYLVEGGSSDTTHLYTESKALFAMDTETGILKWMYEANNSIRHNAIAIGAGAVYFVDRPTAREDRLGHWGEVDHPVGKLVALDSETGEKIWEKPNPEGWGTLLVLSTERDALLVTYNSIRGYMPSEIGGRMALYRASDGEPQWDEAVSVGYGINVSEDGVERPLAEDRMNSKGNQNYPYGSRPIVLADRDMIFFEPYMFNLTTGEQLGSEFDRAYNCGAIAASADMLVYRSATLGYVDLGHWEERTKNWGGFRPACWLNTIPAGGLVLIPQGVEECDCSYLMQTSVALEPR